MSGSYTAFEIEAERRREVLADSMRDSRGTQPAHEDAAPDPCEGDASGGHSLAEFAASLVNRVAQRVQI